MEHIVYHQQNPHLFFEGSLHLLLPATWLFQDITSTTTVVSGGCASSSVYASHSQTRGRCTHCPHPTSRPLFLLYLSNPRNFDTCSRLHHLLHLLQPTPDSTTAYSLSSIGDLSSLCSHHYTCLHFWWLKYTHADQSNSLTHFLDFFTSDYVFLHLLPTFHCHGESLPGLCHHH